ncbi:hypothetical protein [Oleiharenicola lentus]|uniref:hypothetical protein n=1 Tax=Oleiharenicola lentus TaxID=2508720 RepID=UPI003F670894
MSETDPKHLIIGTAWLKGHATVPGANPEKPASYTAIDFGELPDSTLKLEAEIKEQWGSKDGEIGLEDLRSVKKKITLETQIKKLSPEMLARMMGSASGTAPKPGKPFEFYGWLGVQAEGEKIVAATGAGILVLHSFYAKATLSGDFKLNGEDFTDVKLTMQVMMAVAPGLWTAGVRPNIAA